MGNKDKNKDQGNSAAIEGAFGDNITSPREACHTNRDLSWEREAQDTTLAKQVAEAIAREIAKAHMHYQALLNERLWTPLTGLRTKLSIRDGKCGQKRQAHP